MLHESSKPISLSVFLVLLSVVPAYASRHYKVSNYGGGHQIWFESEDYDQRDPDTDAYFKVVDAAGAFGKAVTRTGGAGGMIRYTFDISKADGKGGTWYFWGRVIVPNNNSDWMIVEGNPGEPAIPSSPPYPGTSSATGFTSAQQIFEENLGPSWTWGRTSHGHGHTKQLRDGENTMYILHRQGKSENFWDVFMWTDSASYVPTDDDYRNAIAPVPGKASDPRPAAGAVDVPRDSVLSWASGLPGQKHDVYFGTNEADVGAATVMNPLGVLVGTHQDASTFDPPGLLQYGKTYYWRIDEVNTTPDATVLKGSTWSFTAEPFSYPLANVTATASSAQAGMEPVNTVNGSGLNANGQHSTDGKQMWLSAGVLPNWIQYEFDTVCKLDELWVWNFNELTEKIVGFGAKDVVVEYSTDGSTWTSLAGVPVFTQASSSSDYVHDTTIDFGGVLAKYVKLTINSTWGAMAQSGLSEVRFFYVPVQAREPEPEINATGQDANLTLSWRPGREAASHKVYLSSDPNAVAKDTVPARTVTANSLDVAALNLGTTYYWRVDEVNDAMAPKSWTGDVWAFTTKENAVIDDFESYKNNSPNRVFQAWIDGVGFSPDEFFPKGNAGNGSGAMVGNDPQQGNIMETANVHGGNQAMPLYYDNTAAPNYSEAVRTFDTPQDWTASGIKSLSLYFRGVAGNSGQLYLKINSTKVPYNGNASDIAKLAWLPWNIDLSTVGGSLNKVTTLTIGIEGSGAKGIVYIDDIRLYPKSPEYLTPSDPGKANLLALYACEGNANDTSGHGLNGTVKQATFVASGRPNGGSALQVEKVGYVDLGNPASLNFGAGDWTVTAWYKTAMTGTGDANKGTIYSKGGDNTGGKRYALVVSENVEGVVTLVTDDDVTKYAADAKSKTNDDQWHFVVGQRVGTTLKIYTDGQLENSTTIAAAYDLSGTSQHNAYLGAITNHADGSTYKLFNGLLDEVHVYNRALSQEEVLWLAGYTGPVAKPF